MSANQIQVRRKQLKPKSNSKLYIFISLAAVIFLGGAVFFAGGIFLDKFSPASLEIVAAGDRKIIRVPKGGDLQAAVNKAQSGDIIELQAGAVYKEINLPNKNLTDFITIQSSSVKQLPENKRVSPGDAGLMAKIITSGGGKAAVTTENGAHNYRFIGIEFAPENKDYVYNLIYLAASTDKTVDVPHDLEFDRCYIHSIEAGVSRRGMALNSANTTVQNSYFEGFAYKEEETQGICGWTGTKNVKILNNYIEGGAESLLFGGSDPASADLIPQDIEVRGNYFYKPAAWKGRTMKNLFELKNAKRVKFTGNYLENSWAGAALTITVRNQEGNAPFSTIEDILIKDNIIKNAGEGINILGRDDVHPSQSLKGLTIANNLFLDIGNKAFQGSGYFVQISGGENILISNNTVFNSGNLTTLYGDLPKNFLFRDNIAGHGKYGIHGHPDIKSPAAQKLFQNNVIVNNQKIDKYDSSFPSNNFWAADYESIGFVNFAQNDFGLAAGSRFKGKGEGKTDIGCDVRQLPANPAR